MWVRGRLRGSGAAVPECGRAGGSGPTVVGAGAAVSAHRVDLIRAAQENERLLNQVESAVVVRVGAT